MRTRMWRERAIASAAVVGWMMLVGRWLLHPPPLTRQTTVPPMELLWLAPATHAPAPASARRPSSARAPVRRLRERPRHIAPATTPQATTLPARDATAATGDALRAQAREWARSQAIEPAQAPWADRRTQLPGRAADRFALRDPPSLAGALAKVGQLVGGPGYDPDPCPRHQRNIGALLAAGDSPQLQREIDFVRRKCRP